jgi:RNA polymerase sigma-70 factor (ECF subfamily)
MVARRAADASELDELTLTRAQRGEAAACRALVVRYQGPVFALLGRMVGRRGIVDDLAQETFLRVFRALPGFVRGGPARLSTWILTIATRLALDELARRPTVVVPLEPIDRDLAGDARADVGAERAAIGRAIQIAVGKLSPDQQAVFLLREYHGLEYEEIARALDVDVGTVKSRLSRARAQLRASLGDLIDGDDA